MRHSTASMDNRLIGAVVFRCAVAPACIHPISGTAEHSIVFASWCQCVAVHIVSMPHTSLPHKRHLKLFSHFCSNNECYQQRET